MHFLCEQLGGFTVEELGQRMSAPELSDWIAFYDIKHEQEKEAMKKNEMEIRAKQAAGQRKWL